MRLLISDANILIDMEAGALMETLFQLPMQFGIPDLLYYEEIEPGSPGLEDLGLQIMEVSGDSWRMPSSCQASTTTLPAKNGSQTQSQRLPGARTCETGILYVADRRRQSSNCCQQGTSHGHGHDWAAVHDDRKPAANGRRCLHRARQNERRQASSPVA
jgi:hypothetical protein